MYRDFSYQSVLASAGRAAWQLEDVFPPGTRLEFTCPFLPEALARTGELPFLSPAERLTLNHIRGHEYLAIFGLVEEFILPFVLDHVRTELSADDWRTRALLNFAGEEAKHIQLFRRFRNAFARDFGHRCESIGPPEAIAAQVLAQDPMAVALVILMIEWMTQAHYLDSVRDDTGIDPLFESLLRHHWMEEAGHARLDTLMVEALAEGRDDAGIASAIDGFFAIASLLDQGLATQAALNLEAFERATNRRFDEDERATFLARQHQALRHTYIGSGATHPRFRATLGAVSPRGLAALDAVAPNFN